jgi:hypothetical protein
MKNIAKAGKIKICMNVYYSTGTGNHLFRQEKDRFVLPLSFLLRIRVPDPGFRVDK